MKNLIILHLLFCVIFYLREIELRRIHLTASNGNLKQLKRQKL